MRKETEEKLACSLTAETTELLPFLPYLLQDLWELGSNPRDILKLMKKHMPLTANTRLLDLACGKGAVSINIAKELGLHVSGFDLIPEFVEYSRRKADEMGVGLLCCFACGDVNEVVNTEKNYDAVVFGAAGNVLGTPAETLAKLRSVVKPKGYIIIDEAYLPGDVSNDDVSYKNYEYLTHKQWLGLFESHGLALVEELTSVEDYDFESDNKAIAARAHELSTKHPEKRAIFEGYVQSQLNECDDLENNIIAVTWMLQRIS